MSAESLPAAVGKFGEYLRNEKRYSPATISNYTRSLNQLCTHLETLRIARWRDVHTDQIQGFIAKSHRNGLSAGSLRDMLSAYRSFYRWLARESAAATNPAVGVRPPK